MILNMIYDSMWAVRNRKTGEIAVDLSGHDDGVRPVLFKTRASAKRSVLKTGRVIRVMLVEICQKCGAFMDSTRPGFPSNLCWPCGNEKRLAPRRRVRVK